MKLAIHATLDYALPQPVDLILQVEAAALPEQAVTNATLDVSPSSHFARAPAQDTIGERIFIRAEGQLQVDYRANVEILRRVADIAGLEALQPHKLPGETVSYLFDSAYCPASQFRSFVHGDFGHLSGGAQIAALRDFVHEHFRYVPGSSDATTTALESFVRREGVCRDFAHVLIALARAANVPARIASVYALGVDPPDFHAVAEVFLGGEWHLVDPTGMATEGAMAKIGVGRDAADVSFLTSFGPVQLCAQSVSVEEAAPPPQVAAAPQQAAAPAPSPSPAPSPAPKESAPA